MGRVHKAGDRHAGGGGCDLCQRPLNYTEKGSGPSGQPLPSRKSRPSLPRPWPHLQVLVTQTRSLPHAARAHLPPGGRPESRSPASPSQPLPAGNSSNPVLRSHPPAPQFSSPGPHPQSRACTELPQWSPLGVVCQAPCTARTRASNPRSHRPSAPGGSDPAPGPSCECARVRAGKPRSVLCDGCCGPC